MIWSSDPIRGLNLDMIGVLRTNVEGKLGTFSVYASSTKACWKGYVHNDISVSEGFSLKVLTTSYP